MKTGQATGFQIAFLMFAVMLLAVPLSSFIIGRASLSGVPQALVEKGLHFALACAVIASIGPLRRFAVNALATKILPSARLEVAIITLGKLSLAFATGATIALWSLLTQGSALEVSGNADRDYAFAFSEAGLVRMILSFTVVPLIEELVFRGFIYRAFERQWGWFASMLATSVLFGLYHPFFWSAFTSSLIFIALMRRTGSLRAPIIAHATYNLMLWWPLLGRHIFPPASSVTEPSAWYFHGACLIAAVIWVPTYVWMSRDRNTIAPTQFLEPHAPLPK